MHELIDFVNIFRFDIGKKVWENRKSMPRGIYGYAAIEFNGKIFVAKDGLFYYYDPAIDDWEKLNSIFACTPSLGKTNELIYAIEPNWILHSFNANNRKWTTVISANYSYSMHNWLNSKIAKKYINKF